jgi:hypothetical protein
MLKIALSCRSLRFFVLFCACGNRKGQIFLCSIIHRFSQFKIVFIMKKVIFFATALTCCFFLVKCVQDPLTTPATKKVADFFEYGDAHNDALDNAALNYPEDLTSVTVDECFDKIKNFNMAYALSEWGNSQLVDLQAVQGYAEEFKNALPKCIFMARLALQIRTGT